MKDIISTNLLLHQFVGTNIYETPIPYAIFQTTNDRRHQSPLFICRHQPIGDNNPLCLFVGTNLQETPIHSVALQVPTYIIESTFVFTMLSISSTFTKSGLFFYLHKVCYLLPPSPGLLVFPSFTKSTSCNTCYFWLLSRKNLAQNDMNSILHIWF